MLTLIRTELGAKRNCYLRKKSNIRNDKRAEKSNKFARMAKLFTSLAGK